MALRGRCASASPGRALRALLAAAVGLVLLTACGGTGGGETGESAATAAARFKGGMEGLRAGVEAGMPPQVVTMTRESRFEPARLTVPRGATVAWRNEAPAPHTVTADPARAQSAANVQLPAGAAPFGSESLAQGQTFTHQFTVAGEYRYVCRIHEASGMVGTVVVE
jgi:plastocyanin